MAPFRVGGGDGPPPVLPEASAAVPDAATPVSAAPGLFKPLSAFEAAAKSFGQRLTGEAERLDAAARARRLSAEADVQAWKGLVDIDVSRFASAAQARADQTGKRFEDVVEDIKLEIAAFNKTYARHAGRMEHDRQGRLVSPRTFPPPPRRNRPRLRRPPPSPSRGS